MLHLRAREARPERLISWKGRHGNFVKTFLINDQRNKNGWRVTWSSIRNHAKDFIGQPGIEYTKCTRDGPGGTQDPRASGTFGRQRPSGLDARLLSQIREFFSCKCFTQYGKRLGFLKA